MQSDRFSTGSFGLDVIMGGGWKRGAINEIWGDTGTGKTILAKQTLQHRPIADKFAIWVDTGPQTKLTADPNLMVVHPSNAEQVFEVLKYSAEHGAHLAIVDDASHLVRAEEYINPDYVPDAHREFKLELNSLKVTLAATGMTVVFLSQPRSTQRAPIRGTGISEKSAERIQLKVEKKPQTGESFIRASRKETGDTTAYWVVPGRGIDRTRELIYYGLVEDFIYQTAGWFRWKQHRIHGMEALTEYFETHTQERYGLETLLREEYGLEY